MAVLAESECGGDRDFIHHHRPQNFEAKLVIEFAHPSEEFKRLNPQIFPVSPAEEQVVRAPPAAPTLKLEKRLQVEILNTLRLKGIVAIRSRMDKRTTNPVGTPDFLFAVQCGLRSIPVAIECKVPGGKLTPEQQEMAIRMMESPNGWCYHIVTSVNEMLQILRKLGITGTSNLNHGEGNECKSP